MNQPQVIFDATGQPAFAVIPWTEYERLAKEYPEALLSDEELYDHAKEEKGESFPIEVVDRLLAGQNPIKVYRSHRNMTQAELGTAASINAIHLSQIETGKRTPSTNTLVALAQALNITVDDLL